MILRIINLQVLLSMRIGTLYQVQSFAAPAILSSVTDTSHVIYQHIYFQEFDRWRSNLWTQCWFLFNNQKTTIPKSRYWCRGFMIFNIPISSLNYLYLVEWWSHRFFINIKVVIFFTLTVKGVALNCFWIWTYNVSSMIIWRNVIIMLWSDTHKPSLVIVKMVLNLSKYFPNISFPFKALDTILLLNALL